MPALSDSIICRLNPPSSRFPRLQGLFPTHHAYFGIHNDRFGIRHVHFGIRNDLLRPRNGDSGLPTSRRAAASAARAVDAPFSTFALRNFDLQCGRSLLLNQ